MARVRLRCVDKQYRDELWTLKLLGRGVVLEDEDGTVRASFPHRRAEDNFTLPSFWNSVKYLGIKLDDGTVASFEPGKKAVALVKEYRDESLADQGPRAVANLRNRGLVELLLGLGLVCVALILTVLLVASGEHNWQNRRIPGAAWVVAAIELYRGTSALIRAGRIGRRLAERDEDDEYDDED